MTTAEQLTEINTAITAILTGAQEVWSRNKRVRRADLPALLAERKRLEGVIAGTYYDVTVANFDRR